MLAKKSTCRRLSSLTFTPPPVLNVDQHVPPFVFLLVFASPPLSSMLVSMLLRLLVQPRFTSDEVAVKLALQR